MADAALRDGIKWLRRLGWANQRKWSEFAERFAPPSRDWRVIEKRIFTNALYYRTNYVLVFLAVSLYSLLTNWWLLWACLMVLTGWTYVFGIRRRPIVVGTRVLGAVQTIGVLWLASTLFMWLVGVLWDFCFMTTLATSLCLLHAVLRPQNMKSRYERSLYNIKQWKATTLASSDDDDDDTSDHPSETEAMEGGRYVTRQRPGSVQSRRAANQAYAQRRAQLLRSTGGVGSR